MHVITYVINEKVKKKRIRALAPVIAERIRQVYNKDLSLRVSGDDKMLLVECMVELKAPMNPDVSPLDQADMHTIVQSLGEFFHVGSIDVGIIPATEEQEIGWALFTRKRHIEQGGMIQ